jgi:hypothetical protein
MVVLACFTLIPAPNVFAVDPPPNGGYPGDNTAEGTNALQNVTAGPDSTPGPNSRGTNLNSGRKRPGPIQILFKDNL